MGLFSFFKNRGSGHIPELIAGLYLKHIRKYPDWKSIAPEYMPECVTAAINTGEGKMKIILNLHEYEFWFKEWSFNTPDGKTHARGLLEIFKADGTKIFGLLLAKGKAGDRNRWEASETETFERGPWIDDFKKLASEILAIIREKAREAHEG